MKLNEELVEQLKKQHVKGKARRSPLSNSSSSNDHHGDQHRRRTREGGPSNRGDILEFYQTTRAAKQLFSIARGTTVTPREEP